MCRILIALAGILLIGRTALAAGPLPPIVEAHVKADVKDCPTHNARFEKGFMTRRDINGDGEEDYLLDYGHFICGGSSTTFCGSAGCLVTVFASSSTGYRKIFDDNAQHIEFRKIRGRPAMFLGLHGSACGKVGSAPCGKTLYWNGSTFSAAD